MMFALVRNCRPVTLASHTKCFLRQGVHNFRKNVPPKLLFRNILLTRSPSLGSFLKVSNLLGAIRTKTSVCPRNTRPVGYWMLTCSGMVFAAVVLGGVTRLTESGLSMVTWKLLGEKMPTTEEEWNEEFAKYREFPEFKMKNKDMTLSEFKRIWYMEFVHRSWGRAIGAVFLIPAVVFWATGSFSKVMKIRVLAMTAVLGAQGLYGWYMVQSGLEEERFQDPNDVPRVSQYRLATHLGLALILYSLFLWSAMEHLWPPGLIFCRGKRLKAARRVRVYAHICKGLVFLTAISGAFVAGLDAGLVYNSFPKMGDNWVPDDIMQLEPKVKNFSENPTTVQFNHRVLGTTTVTLITLLWALSRTRVLPRKAYSAATMFMVAAWLQVGLGITTLLNHVPTELAAGHQSGSLVLLSMALWLTHELKRLPRVRCV